MAAEIRDTRAPAREADRKRLLRAHDRAHAAVAAAWRERGYQYPPPVFPAFPEECRGLTCDAKTRKGTPCKRTDIYESGRCKLHGGLSTGPRTAEGKRRSAANLPKPHERLSKVNLSDVDESDGRRRKPGDEGPLLRQPTPPEMPLAVPVAPRPAAAPESPAPSADRSPPSPAEGGGSSVAPKAPLPPVDPAALFQTALDWVERRERGLRRPSYSP